MAKYVVDIESGTVLSLSTCVIVDSEKLDADDLEVFGESDSETIELAKLHGEKIVIPD